MKAFKTIFRCELKLSLRDMNLLLFGLLLPVGFAAVLGMIIKDKPAFDGAQYSFLAQSFGAISSIGICATGLMGIPLTLSDYRHKKLLKRFRVTPASPALLLFVQFAVNLLYTLSSLVLVYLTCLAFGMKLAGNPIWFILSFLLVVWSIYSIGLLIASVSPNIKTSNMLCTVLYFPMLFLSGATVPYEVMPKVMQKIMDVLPLTQGVKLLKATSLGLPMEDMLVPVFILAAFAVVCTGVSIRYFRWE